MRHPLQRPPRGRTTCACVCGSPAEDLHIRAGRQIRPMRSQAAGQPEFPFQALLYQRSGRRADVDACPPAALLLAGPGPSPTCPNPRQPHYQTRTPSNPPSATANQPRPPSNQPPPLNLDSTTPRTLKPDPIPKVHGGCDMCFPVCVPLAEDSRAGRQRGKRRCRGCRRRGGAGSPRMPPVSGKGR